MLAFRVMSDLIGCDADIDLEKLILLIMVETVLQCVTLKLFNREVVFLYPQVLKLFTYRLFENGTDILDFIKKTVIIYFLIFPGS